MRPDSMILQTLQQLVAGVKIVKGDDSLPDDTIIVSSNMFDIIKNTPLTQFPVTPHHSRDTNEIHE